MNLSALRTSVLNRVGGVSGDVMYASSVLTELINEAVHAIEVEYDWPWLEAVTTHTTTAGTQTLTVPTDWLRTRSLWIANYDPMQTLGFADLRTQFDVSNQAQPECFAIAADTIYLGPVPDAAYTVNHLYVKREPDLSSDTDSPLMPASFHAAIVEHATYLALRRTREEARAAVALDAYQGWLRRMVDNRRRSTAPMRVRVRPGGHI